MYEPDDPGFNPLDSFRSSKVPHHPSISILRIKDSRGLETRECWNITRGRGGNLGAGKRLRGAGLWLTLERMHPNPGNLPSHGSHLPSIPSSAFNPARLEVRALVTESHRCVTAHRGHAPTRARAWRSANRSCHLRARTTPQLHCRGSHRGRAPNLTLTGARAEAHAVSRATRPIRAPARRTCRLSPLFTPIHFSLHPDNSPPAPQILSDSHKG